MVASTVKNGNERLRKGNRRRWKIAETAEYAVVHQQGLEDTGKPVGKFTNTFLPWRNSLKTFFFSSRTRLSSSNCSFIVYCKRCLPTSFCWRVIKKPQMSRTGENWTNHEACKKPIRNPPIRNDHIYPCDSAGYQNKLLYTNSQTDYTKV